jgi:hypothetical protein
VTFSFLTLQEVNLSPGRFQWKNNKAVNSSSLAIPVMKSRKLSYDFCTTISYSFSHRLVHSIILLASYSYFPIIIYVTCLTSFSQTPGSWNNLTRFTAPAFNQVKKDHLICGGFFLYWICLRYNQFNHFKMITKFTRLKALTTQQSKCKNFK